uniref:Uncharacterized protein n=1 Tax=Lactuca sativa TaxID=4236 RepID=A0A9R1VY52_LACSA|nr:hypothetical protein LSAT_V11C400166780 [Lactuca sativa]
MVERPCFSDHLEIFWFELFKKHIYNLKMNHKGTFVLQDDNFAWVSCMASTGNSGSTHELGIGNKATEANNMHLYFPCGIIGELFQILAFLLMFLQIFPTSLLVSFKLILTQCLCHNA